LVEEFEIGHKINVQNENPRWRIWKQVFKKYVLDV